MQIRFRAACLSLLLLLPAAVHAQGRTAVVLDDPSPPSWDASGHIGWLTVNKSGLAPEWNRWYDVAAFGGSVGRFIGPHLKIEFDAAASTTADVYVEHVVNVPTQSYPVIFTQPERFRAATLSAGVSYQFLNNRWLHPVVGAGIEATRETRTVDDVIYYGPSVPVAPTVDVQGTTVSWRNRPFADVGFKWFVSERGFIRSDVRTTFDTGGVDHVSWRGGFGFDF